MRHHIFLTLSVTLILGLALSEAFAFFPLTVTLTLFGLAFCWRGGGRLSHLLYGLLLISVLYGQYRYWHVAEDDVVHFTGQEVTLTATVATPPHREGGTLRFEAMARQVVTDGRAVPASGRIRVSRYLKYDPADLAYGDTFTATVTLKPITSLANPGGFDWAAYQWRKGIRTHTSISHRTALAITRSASLMGVVHDWRRRMQQLARNALTEDAAAFATALAAGDARGISEELRQTFQAAGLAHVLAVSGTHLGLVAGVVFLLIQWAVRRLPYGILLRLTRHLTPRQAAALAALVTVIGYALLAGGRTPTLRALVMVALVMGALLLRRQAHGLTGLGVAAVLILLVDPRAIGQASFQLSFAAVTAILLALMRLNRPEPADTDTIPTDMLAPEPPPPTFTARCLRALTTSAVVTLAAGLATAPLVAWHFGQIAWPGFVANLLLLPLLGFVVLPLVLFCMVLAPAFGELPLAGLMQTLLDGFLSACGAFAALPGALSHVPAPPLPVLVASYGVALLILTGHRHLSRATQTTGGVVVALAWLVALHPAPATGTLRVAMLDVGQGDGAVVTGPDGSALVIDGGTRWGRFDTGRLALDPYLTANGVRRLSLLASHPQQDHQGGLTHLVSRFHPERVYSNGDSRPDSRFLEAFNDAAKNAGVSPVRLWAGTPFAPLPGIDSDVLHPPPGPARATARADNNRSLVVRIRHGRHSFLFAGDIEKDAEAMLAASGRDLTATVLKVPHHGSASSSSAHFVERVAPRLAVISAGNGNRYGHPSPKVVRRYRERNVPILSTASVGAILMETDGHTLKVASQRLLHPERVAPWSAAPWSGEYLNALRLFAPRRLWREVES
ncbi:MAG: DNA internalization-related competence protein ComEC/Rec2 [Leptospirillia bacterium]